jgi:hypothetical protein
MPIPPRSSLSSPRSCLSLVKVTTSVQNESTPASQELRGRELGYARYRRQPGQLKIKAYLV